MNNMRFKTIPLLVAGLMVVLFPSFSYAYLDPGTGSYILQITIAGLVSGIFIVKTYFHNIRKLIRKIFLRNVKDDK